MDRPSKSGSSSDAKRTPMSSKAVPFVPRSSDSAGQNVRWSYPMPIVSGQWIMWSGGEDWANSRPWGWSSSSTPSSSSTSTADQAGLVVNAMAVIREVCATESGYFGPWLSPEGEAEETTSDAAAAAAAPVKNQHPAEDVPTKVPPTKSDSLSLPVPRTRLEGGHQVESAAPDDGGSGPKGATRYISPASPSTQYCSTGRASVGSAAGGGLQSQSLSLAEEVPVKCTFIHFNDETAAVSHPHRSHSAPPTCRVTDTESSALLAQEHGQAFVAEESLGSLEAHERGTCQPCAYFRYKRNGCRRGDECSFCHHCPRGEVRRRKKMKSRLLKAAALEAAAAAGEADGDLESDVALECESFD